MKIELQAFLGKINYLCKFSSHTADAYESIRKLMSVKTEWTWKATYQRMFNKAKAIIKEDACMEFYDEAKLLNIRTDASGVGLGAACYKQKAILAVPRMKLQTTAYSDPLYSQIQQYRKIITRHTMWT